MYFDRYISIWLETFIINELAVAVPLKLAPFKYFFLDCFTNLLHLLFIFV